MHTETMREYFPSNLLRSNDRKYISCNLIITVPNPVEQNRIPESPLLSGSSTDSSCAYSSTMMVTPHQQDFILTSPEHFLNFANPVEMCSPYNSTTNTDFCPPSSYRVDMDTKLHTATNNNSIPPATSVPFPNSQTQNFIPQAPLSTDFDSQIPCDFNFLSNATAPNLQNLDIAQSLDVSMLGGQTFDGSNPLLVNSSDRLSCSR